MNRRNPISNQPAAICRAFLALFAACCLAGCNWSSSSTLALENDCKSSSASEDAAAPAEQPSTTLQAKLEKVDRSQLVGTWRDTFLGTRTLTLNDDGTARMILDLDFAGRLLYGSRLDFNMTWTVEGATITIDILDGKPAKSAKSAMETWGKRYAYLLDCVEDHQIEMRDWDGSANYKLRRLPDEPAEDSSK